MLRRHLAAIGPAALLVALILIGLVAHFLEPAGWREALERARDYAGRWWLAPALILLQVVLFTFGLPGSSVLWLVAPLYAPAAATLILAAGGGAGALTAYLFARRLTDASRARLRASRGFRALERESDFLVLCALRVVPAFPHSVLNYGAGILNLPLAQFLGASLIGLALKSYLYSSVIHQALQAAEPADLLKPRAVLPLVLVALAFLVGRTLRRRASRRPPAQD